MRRGVVDRKLGAAGAHHSDQRSNRFDAPVTVDSNHATGSDPPTRQESSDGRAPPVESSVGERPLTADGPNCHSLGVLAHAFRDGCCNGRELARRRLKGRPPRLAQRGRHKSEPALRPDPRRSSRVQRPIRDTTICRGPEKASRPCAVSMLSITSRSPADQGAESRSAAYAKRISLSRSSGISSPSSKYELKARAEGSWREKKSRSHDGSTP